MQNCDANLAAAASNCYTLSQTYMDLALVFLEDQLYKPSLLLGDRALKSMMKAIYIKEYGKLPPASVSFNDLSSLPFHSRNSDMDSEFFLSISLFLCNLESAAQMHKLEESHVVVIMGQIYNLLKCLSTKFRKDEDRS